eukprot:3886852-Rhodomonas_salina.1
MPSGPDLNIANSPQALTSALAALQSFECSTIAARAGVRGLAPHLARLRTTARAALDRARDERQGAIDA